MLSAERVQVPGPSGVAMWGQAWAPAVERIQSQRKHKAEWCGASTHPSVPRGRVPNLPSCRGTQSDFESLNAGTGRISHITYRKPGESSPSFYGNYFFATVMPYDKYLCVLEIIYSDWHLPPTWGSPSQGTSWIMWDFAEVLEVSNGRFPFI